MPAFILPILNGVFGFFTSSGGALVVVFLVGAGVGHHWAVGSCRDREAAADAARLRAQLTERARQTKAEAKIVSEDAARATAAEARAKDMQSVIDELQDRLRQKEATDGGKKDAKTMACPEPFDRDDFTRRVRRIDAAGRHR